MGRKKSQEGECEQGGRERKEAWENVQWKICRNDVTERKAGIGVRGV